MWPPLMNLPLIGQKSSCEMKELAGFQVQKGRYETRERKKEREPKRREKGKRENKSTREKEMRKINER